MLKEYIGVDAIGLLGLVTVTEVLQFQNDSFFASCNVCYLSSAGTGIKYCMVQMDAVKLESLDGDSSQASHPNPGSERGTRGFGRGRGGRGGPRGRGGMRGSGGGGGPPGGERRPRAPEVRYSFSLSCIVRLFVCPEQKFIVHCILSGSNSRSPESNLWWDCNNRPTSTRGDWCQEIY